MKGIHVNINPSLLVKVLFILFAACFTSIMLLFYSLFLEEFIPRSNMVREFIICFGQIAFQCTLLLLFKKGKILLEYIYQMMVVSFQGACVLFLIMLFGFRVYTPPYYSYYFAGLFFLVVAFMFFSHKKRVRKINAPHWLTYTWVLYRILALFFIL